MISTTRIIFLLGFLLVLLPFLGVPQIWKTIFLVATGLFLLYSGFVIQRKSAALRRAMREMKKQYGAE